MAGIYIHIPFCQSRCIYCDFFSSTSRKNENEYIDTICREIESRKDYLLGQTIRTIYFGGGTPSQLSADQFGRIFNQIEQSFGTHTVLNTLEITLEANPDDLTSDYLKTLKELPFNRVSIGIQSFNDNELRFLNRRHNAKAAIQAVKEAQQCGFGNISIDLMYGLPGQIMDSWQKSLQQAMELDVQHISAYHLTYEEGTKLHQLLEKNEIKLIDEELSLAMFATLINSLSDAGFIQYEISNFGKKGYFSKHNSSYWNGAHYLGIGAAAHSYNGTSRQWNKASHSYSLEEYENIDQKTAYNDFIITRLRTMDGISLFELKNLFGNPFFDYCLNQAQKFIQDKSLESDSSTLKLTKKGIFVSDQIISDLLSV